MKENVKDKIRHIVVVGDAYVSPAVLTEAAHTLPFENTEVSSRMWGTGNKEEFSEMQTRLEQFGPEGAAYPKELDTLIEEVDILLIHFCPIPESLIKRAKKLKLVGLCRGGAENVDGRALAKKGIPLVHIIRNAEAVAEFTLGMMLAETRNIARSHHKICLGEWTTDFCNTEFTSTLNNMTVGVIGLGNIGALLAEKLHAIQVRVLGYDAFLAPEVRKAMPVELVESPEEIFRRADIISIHLRLTAETKGIINRELLSQMKETSYLSNASRAGLIDEEALLDVLRSHKIAGAALDVFEEEPLEKGHPLTKMDNVTLTPHIAGDTVDSIARSPFLLVKAIYDYLVNGNEKYICNKPKKQEK